jgi:hypothetical protein
MNILNTDQKLIPLPTLPGKLAPPIFGPCGARLLIVRLAAYVPAVDGTTGRDSAGVARPSRAAQMMDCSMVRMYGKASSRLRTSVKFHDMILIWYSSCLTPEQTKQPTGGRARAFCTERQRFRCETCTLV